MRSRAESAEHDLGAGPAHEALRRCGRGIAFRSGQGGTGRPRLKTIRRKQHPRPLQPALEREGRNDDFVALRKLAIPPRPCNRDAGDLPGSPTVSGITNPVEAPVS